MLDSDALFDQQASILLEQSQRRTTAAPLRTQGLSATASSIIDNIAGRVNTLEERLNACDSIYRLAAQANAVREKERREQYQSFVQHANALNQRLAKAEERVAQIPQMIKDAVREEMKKYDNTKMVTSMVEEASGKMSHKISEIDRKFTEVNKKTQKALKKLKLDAQLARSEPEDDGKVEEITQQIAELKRRQNLMYELMNAMRSHNDQDFDGVNSQLTGLWTQLAVKRGESPRKAHD